MTAEELLAEVEALGVIVTLDREELVLRPRSRLSPELVDRLREHKPELLDLVELRSWPAESQDAVRRFGQPCARLYPFIGRTILTPWGPGRLLQVFSERATVALATTPGRASFFPPSDLRPPGVAATGAFEELRTH